MIEYILYILLLFKIRKKWQLIIQYSVFYFQKLARKFEKTATSRDLNEHPPADLQRPGPAEQPAQNTDQPVRPPDGGTMRRKWRQQILRFGDETRSFYKTRL